MRYQLEPYNQHPKPARPLPGISLRSFMERTTIYEDLPVPFDRQLRQGTWVGMGIIVACTLLMLLLRVIGYGASSGLFVLGDQLFSYLDWLVGGPWLFFWVNVLLLASSVALLVVTRGLRRGKELYHRLAFALLLYALVDVCLFLFPIVVLLLNLLILLLIIACVSLILGAILSSAG